MRRRAVGWVLLGCWATSTGVAQSARRVVAPDSAVVVADSSFARGGISRWLLGDTYRALWTAPVKVEVLDLDRFAGGLTPTELGGRLQTRSLRLKGADGRTYQFRLVRKQLNPVWWEGYEGTLIGNIAKDQLSALHPGGALVVSPLLEAAGIVHIVPQLRLMPDDPRLGEFRAEFANQLGAIEMRPEGLEGKELGGACIREVKSTKDLFEALRARPEVRVDSRAYLVARLMDLLIGDWDRHEDQYNWALMEGEGPRRWHPIPRDRDYAFVHYDGAIMHVGRRFASSLVRYGEAHEEPPVAARLGIPLDRRLLSELPWPAWDSVARRLQTRLTDAVIASAVVGLPRAYEDRNGPMLRRVLEARRDSLVPAARAFYDFLSRYVHVFGGDQADRLELERTAQGTRLRLFAASRREPYFDRVFRAEETQEIRVFLRGGPDRAQVRGDGAGPVVRIVSGAGRDSLADASRGRWVRFYDDDGFSAENGTRVETRRYTSPDSTDELIVRRDWGARLKPSPRLQVSSHSGIALGLELTRTAYAFRSEPYTSRHSVSVDHSFRRGTFRFRGMTRWHPAHSPFYFGVSMLASGIEGGRFYGFGNATPTGPASEFPVRRQAYELAPYLGLGLESRTRLWLLFRARQTVTDLDDLHNRASGIRALNPPGMENAGKFGPVLRLEHDSRNTPVAARSGVLARLEAEYVPVTWKNGEGPFGAVDALLATYLSPVPERLTLALRAGGRAVFGDFPYFEAGYLGGNRSLRGFSSGRFAGDRSVYGNGELRVKLFDNRWILPLEVGALGLADAGRVWFEGESDGGWHTDLGAGLWLSAFKRQEGLTIGMARSDERRRFFFLVGTPF